MMVVWFAGIRATKKLTSLKRSKLKKRLEVIVKTKSLTILLLFFCFLQQILINGNLRTHFFVRVAFYIFVAQAII